MTPSISVLNFIYQYPNYIDATPSYGMRSVNNELQMQDYLDNRRDIGVAGLAKLWNHWGGLLTLECHRVGLPTNSHFVSCREKDVYERQLVAS